MVLDATGPNFKSVARVHKKWGFFFLQESLLMESFEKSNSGNADVLLNFVVL